MNIRSAASAARGAIHSRIEPGDRAPTLKDIFEGQPVQSFAAGEALIWEGDQAGQIFDVLEGVLRVYKILPDGRRAIMGFVYPNDVLGVLSDTALSSPRRRRQQSRFGAFPVVVSCRW